MTFRPYRVIAGAAWIAFAAGTLGSCQRDAFLGSDARQGLEAGAAGSGSDGATRSDASPRDAAPDATTRDSPEGGHRCVQATCQGHLYDCGDCLDIPLAERITKKEADSGCGKDQAALMQTFFAYVSPVSLYTAASHHEPFTEGPFKKSTLPGFIKTVILIC